MSCHPPVTAPVTSCHLSTRTCGKPVTGDKCRDSPTPPPVTPLLPVNKPKTRPLVTGDSYLCLYNNIREIAYLAVKTPLKHIYGGINSKVAVTCHCSKFKQVHPPPKGENHEQKRIHDRTSTERSLDLAARSLHAIADTLLHIYADDRHA